MASRFQDFPVSSVGDDRRLPNSIDGADDFGLIRPARVLVAHRYRLFRDGLSNMLAACSDAEIIGSVAGRADLLQQAPVLQPDIVLMEPFPADSGELNILASLCESLPETRFLIIARIRKPQQILEALRVGAVGCICEDESVENLIKAIRVVSRGKLWIDRQMIARIFADASANAERPQEPPLPVVVEAESVDSLPEESPYSLLLTPREREIAEHLSAGLSNKRIAAALKISESTIKSHLVNIFRKCGVKDRLQLAMFFRDCISGP